MSIVLGEIDNNVNRYICDVIGEINTKRLGVRGGKVKDGKNW